MNQTAYLNAYVGMEVSSFDHTDIPEGPEGYHLASHVGWNCTREQLISLLQDLPENGVYRCAIATVPEVSA